MPFTYNALKNIANKDNSSDNPLLQTDNAEVVGGDDMAWTTGTPPPRAERPAATISGDDMAWTTGTPPPRAEPISAVTVAPPPDESGGPTTFEPFTGEPAPPTIDPATMTPDAVLGSMFSDMDAFFGGVDWSQFGEASADYLNQLMTGQTQATRAMQAKEAAAMTRGIQNLMNNISASAANAGITGQALSQFYNEGLQKVGVMMGDFAMDNLARMADTQAEGFAGIAKMMNLSADAQRQWVNTYQDWKQYTTGNEQWNKTFGWNAMQYIVNAAAEDPVAGQILGKIYDGLEKGLSFEQILTDTEMDKLREIAAEEQTVTDVAAEVSYIQDELGYEAVVTPRIDSDGNPVLKADGSPVWDVTIASDIADDGSLVLREYEDSTGGLDDENLDEDLDNGFVTIGGETYTKISDYDPTWAIVQDPENSYNKLYVHHPPGQQAYTLSAQDIGERIQPGADMAQHYDFFKKMLEDNGQWKPEWESEGKGAIASEVTPSIIEQAASEPQVVSSIATTGKSIFPEHVGAANTFFALPSDLEGTSFSSHDLVFGERKVSSSKWGMVKQEYYPIKNRETGEIAAYLFAGTDEKTYVVAPGADELTVDGNRASFSR